MVLPASIAGAIDATIENFIMDAIKDVKSLWFGILLNASTTKVAINETDSASIGVIDCIVLSKY